VKIVRIGNDKIKIILSEDEVVNQKSILSDSKDMDRFFEYIAREVQRETGIIIKNTNCLMEGIRSKDGMVLYLTDVSKKNLYNKSNNSRVIFDIDDADNLFMLLSALNEKLCKKMRIYRYNSHFYVSVPRFPIPIMLCEFSLKWRRSHIAESILSEHGTTIAKNEQVAKIIKEIKKHF